MKTCISEMVDNASQIEMDAMPQVVLYCIFFKSTQ